MRKHALFGIAALAPRGPFAPLADGMRQLAIAGNDRWFWACDGCLAERIAIPADVTVQHLGMGTPFAAYVDRPFRCEDCGKQTVFGAREQRHWFETLRFLIWVHPKQCVACRRERRRKAATNQALAAALHGLDATDPVQLEAVARLYDELGVPTKATEMRARARNRRRGA